MGLADHKEVRIVQGVYRAPGDQYSVESSIKTIDLLSPAGGIGLQNWSPNLAALETGGIWTDSPLQVGRTPLVLNEGNVTETMRITINGGSPLGTMKKYSELLIMMQQAREFWTDNAQIDPVYLHWFSACGAGRQYARIYNMEFKPEYTDSPAAIITGSLTIEHEPLWLFVPPGANPKQWRYEYHNQVYSNANASIIGTDSLFYSAGSIANRSEYTNTSYNVLLSNNAIVIPAASIPGDAPALLSLGVIPSGASRWNVIAGKKTRKITVRDTNGLIMAQNTIFNAADGSLGTDATVAADTGASIRASSGIASRVAISFATATNALRWQNIPNIGINTINRFIGRWAVFLRCRQSAGTVGDITMYLRYGTNIADDNDGVKLNVVYAPIPAGGTGNSTVWGLVYMGSITSPIFPGKADVNLGNIGSAASAEGLSSNTNQNLQFGLWALRSAGTGVLYLNDLILIPVDEGSMAIEIADLTSPSSNTMVYDETGYLTHGTPDICVENGTGFGNSQQLVNMSGQGIQLSPNVENTIYVIAYDGSKQSAVSDTFTVAVNIIPRCRGIRTFNNLAGASASG